MIQAGYPKRIRLHGGRNTHGAHTTRYDPSGTHLMTACGYSTWPRDELKPDTAPVTCRACIREMNR